MNKQPRPEPISKSSFILNREVMLLHTLEQISGESNIRFVVFFRIKDVNEELIHS